VFKIFFSFQSLGLAEDAFTNFYSDVLNAIKTNIGGLIILLVPVAVLILIFHDRIDFRGRGIKRQGIFIFGFAIFHAIALFALLLYGRGDYSPYDLYFNSKVADLCGKQLGITTMTRLDMEGLLNNMDELVLADTVTIQPKVTIIPTAIPTVPPKQAVTATPKPTKAAVSTTPVPTQPPTPTPVDTSPNVMNLDFLTLSEQEENNTIKTLHNYFASATPTNKNKYTGMFKGYNLIMITAEGFFPYAVNEKVTPTLYKLTHEGFLFNNFYTALWQTSTSDGEYTAMTGLIPAGSRSMYKGMKNLWPFSLGHQFNKLGVVSKAYHDHSYTYYQRDETSACFTAG
jgi:phosphoglycerol transferase MdoB-like AlkP superfamily enzyme